MRLLIWLTGIITLAVVSHPDAPRAKDKFRFALIPKEMSNPYYDLARDGCKRAEQDFAGAVECVYVGPTQHLAAEQMRIVWDLSLGKVDGIAVAPVHAPAIARALELVAGIPVITWDSDLLPQDADLRTAYVGTNNYDVGVSLAKIVQEYKPNGGTLCIQSADPFATNHNERIRGIRDTLGSLTSTAPLPPPLRGQNGWTELDGCPLFANYDWDTAVRQLETLLEKHPSIDAFVATGGFLQSNPGAYRDVVQNHRARIQSGELVLVVTDALPMQMDLLADGLSLGQVGQRPFDMGYKAIHLLYQLRTGSRVEGDHVYTGLDVCTRDTQDTCLLRR